MTVFGTFALQAAVALATVAGVWVVAVETHDFFIVLILAAGLMGLASQIVMSLHMKRVRLTLAADLERGERHGR